MELTRQSSLERLMGSLSPLDIIDQDTKESSVHAIVAWWKRRLAIVNIRNTVLTKLDDLNIAIRIISCIKENKLSFMEAQELMMDQSFGQALSSFLCSLPRDPSLKSQNKFARSAKVISSAIIISRFPGEILEVDGEPDKGSEAYNCRTASSLVIVTLNRLRNVTASDKGMSEFRHAFVGYRFAVRHFLHALDMWKKLDGVRARRTFEASYMDSYAMLLTTKKMRELLLNRQRMAEIGTEPLSAAEAAVIIQEIENTTTLIADGEAKIAQFREAVEKVLGEDSQDRLAEIDAFVQSTVDANRLEMAVQPSTISSTDVHTSTRTGSMSEAAGHTTVPTTSSEDTTPQDYPVVNLRVNSALEANRRDTPVLSEPGSAEKSDVQRKEYAVLRRVSVMTGLAANCIVHELMVDPNFQIPLPDIAAVLDNDDSRSDDVPLTAAHMSSLVQEADPDPARRALKKHMLRIMDDRLVASMLLSPYKDPSEVKQGDVCAVWFGADTPSSPVSPSDTHAQPGVFMMAKVLSVQDSSAPGGTLSVQYLLDGAMENHIPFERLKLTRHGRDGVSGGFLAQFADIRERIAAVTSNGELRRVVVSVIDVDLLKQMVDNDALDVTELGRLMSSIVSLITDLQSPARKAEYLAWHNGVFDVKLRQCSTLNDSLKLLPRFFEVASARIDELQVEMVNYYLQVLAPFAQREGQSMLRQCLETELTDLVHNHGTDVEGEDTRYSTFLPATHRYLCAQLDDSDVTTGSGDSSNGQEYTLHPELIAFLGENCGVTGLSSTDVGCKESTDRALAVRAFCLLLQTPADLSSPAGALKLPETFVWDGIRLARTRHLIDALAIVSTMLVTVRHFLLAQKVRLSPAQEVEFQTRLFTLLDSKHVSIGHVTADAESFVAAIVAPTSHAASASRSAGASATPLNGHEDPSRLAVVGAASSTSSLGADWARNLDQSLRSCIQPGSSVLALFTGRIYKLLARALTSTSFADRLAPFSMNSPPQVQHLRGIMSSAKQLFDVNISTYGPVYSAILRANMAARCTRKIYA